jgi:hypothetical protein
VRRQKSAPSRPWIDPGVHTPLAKPEALAQVYGGYLRDGGVEDRIEREGYRGSVARVAVQTQHIRHIVTGVEIDE